MPIHVYLYVGVRELGLTYIWLAFDSPLWDSARSEEHYTEDPRRGGEATYQATYQLLEDTSPCLVQASARWSNRRRQPVERIRDTSQRVGSNVTAGPLHRSVLDGYGRYGYNITVPVKVLGSLGYVCGSDFCHAARRCAEGL